MSPFVSSEVETRTALPPSTSVRVNGKGQP